MSETPDHGMPGATAIPFDEPAARAALAEACAVAGLDPGDAELIRIGENGVFRLHGRPIIARVARSARQLGAVTQQLAVARWLAAESVPTIRPLDVDQPVTAAGRVVAFWESADEKVRYGTTRELGVILRHLHQLDPPANLALRPLDPFESTRARIERVHISDADRDFLHARCAELVRAYRGLSFPGGPVVLHGDANVGNLILDRTGRALLSDLDSFHTGPAEWDLVQTAMFYERFGWHTGEEYNDFVTAYGRDILRWPGYETLAQVRELLMVAWLAQNVNEPGPAAELAKRLDTLRTGASRRDWKPL